MLLFCALGAGGGCPQKTALRSIVTVDVVRPEPVGVSARGMRGEACEETLIGVDVSIEPVVGDAHHPVDRISSLCDPTL